MVILQDMLGQGETRREIPIHLRKLKEKDERTVI
jgi:hypothetical protein